MTHDVPLPDSDNWVTGRTALVTGSTSGLGLAVAAHLAQLGALVIVHGPDSRGVEKAVREVRMGAADPSVEGFVADLGSQDEVRGLADRIAGGTDHLDVLVNNAAAVFDRWQADGDGIESTLAVNYLAPYLLTRLLLPLLEKSGDGRVVNVASEAHRGVALNLDDLQLSARYERFDAYKRSKLADLMFTYELARRLDGSAVTANAAHPGTIRTSLFRARNVLERVVMPILSLRARPAGEGADTIVWLAASRAVAGSSGHYYADRMPVASSPESYDEETARKLWDVSADLTALPA